MRSLLRIIPLLLVLSIAPPAQAKQFVVHSCHTPDGRPAPTDGWASNGSAPYMWFDNTCASGGALSAGLAGSWQPANSSTVGWGFHSGAAPIRAYRIVRSGVPRGFNGNASMLLYSSDSENAAHSGRAVDYCAAYRGCIGVNGVLERTTPAIPDGSRDWYFSLVCGGDAGYGCSAASGSDFGNLRIDSASFTLEDADPPDSTTPRGELATSGGSAGSLSFSASDSLSGVRRAVLEVDGAVVASFVPDPAEGRCNEVGQSALPDFRYLRPCPQRTQVELNLPSGALTPGAHSLRARVFDAAGNSTTAFGPRSVDGPPAPVTAKSIGARIVLDHAAGRRIGYGRGLTVSGALVSAAGTPITGAELTVSQYASAVRLSTRAVAVNTDSAGRFSLRLTPRSTRRVTVEHALTGAAATQEISVRSKLKLRALHRRVAPFSTMRLRGSVQTERTRRRASVAIKVKSGRRWKTIGIAPVSTRGRFAFSYRFKRTRHARFTFRAVAIESSDFAVEAMPSNRVRVRVG